MARLALTVVIVMVGAAPARAGIAVDAGVPFTEAELVAALAVRGAAATDVAVRVVSPTSVELRTGVGSQRVDLGATRGIAAARLVALQLAPLGAEPALTARADDPPVDPRRESRWMLGIAAGGGHGAAAIDFALTALRVDAIQRTGPWRLGVSVEWLLGLAKTPDGTAPATANLFPVRAVAGVAIGPVELVAGPELVAYQVTAASSGVTPGIGGELRVRLAAGARWQAIASADVDGFLHQVILARDGMQFAATPRVALTAAIGLAWEGP